MRLVKVRVAVPPTEHTARNSAREAWQNFGSILGRAESRQDDLVGLIQATVLTGKYTVCSTRYKVHGMKNTVEMCRTGFLRLID